AVWLDHQLLVTRVGAARGPGLAALPPRPADALAALDRPRRAGDDGLRRAGRPAREAHLHGHDVLCDDLPPVVLARGGGLVGSLQPDRHGAQSHPGTPGRPNRFSETTNGAGPRGPGAVRSFSDRSKG